MRQFRWWAVVVGVSGALGFAGMGNRAGLGQTVAVPVPVDLGQQIRRLEGELEVLGERIARDLGTTPRGAQLHEEDRELVLAIREFHEGLRNRANRFEARRFYSGIDSSLHHFLAQLGQPGSASPAIDQLLPQIAESDRLLHRTLGLNDDPAGFRGGAQAPAGVFELQRLTHALVDRAEALAAVLGAEVPGPAGARMVEEATNLAKVADTYHDALKLEGQIDALTKNAFAPVEAMANSLQADLAQVPVTPRVRNAWKAYRSVEVLIRRTLGLPTSPEQMAETVLTEMPGGGTPVTELATHLVKQTAEFLQVFRQTGGTVPEGRQFLADAEILEGAAGRFRQDAARNLSPNQLAFEFREIDAIWQRLARRTNRFARGQTGPNIQHIERVGQTIAEIHRLLGLPGYPPQLGPLP